jgi:hypothetical protein
VLDGELVAFGEDGRPSFPNTVQAQRRLIRVALDGAAIAEEIDALVLALIASVAAESTTAT